ncbi:hypothetical protein PAI11_35840 [Patulibacter medicamentivorans]|uniref:Uncharacterized protein n=2 Tax=Patulibacter medicamentivorans TaxID=1097667 RepID=H0E9R4_9ACTN|nr:hypothetical protein PAI11_35840 [Patulibacter medicamentivorans]
MVATTTIDGRHVEVTIQRTQADARDDDLEPAVEEDVLVRAGTRSRLATVIAGPADWIEAAESGRG